MNIILTKILPTNAHHKHPTTHLHTKHTNAANVGVNPLPLLGKSVITAKNQSVKSAINAANLTVAANVKDTANQKDVKDIVGVKDTASRIASTNAKRNRVSV